MPSAILRPLSDGVFPHSVFASPLSVAMWWADPADDPIAIKALDGTTNQFEAVLRAAGQPVDEHCTLEK